MKGDIHKKVYALGDKYYQNPKARFVLTEAFRKPKKGEYYLSGAMPQVYKAPNDLSMEFRIVRPVKVKLISIYVEE